MQPMWEKRSDGVNAKYLKRVCGRDKYLVCGGRVGEEESACDADVGTRLLQHQSSHNIQRQ